MVRQSKKPSSNFQKLLQERIEKTNPRRTLTSEESKRLSKLEGIADKLMLGENVQNRQLQTWLTEDEYSQIETEWKEQLELREELKNKPSDLKRYEDKLKQATLTKRFPKTWPKARLRSADRSRTNQMSYYQKRDGPLRFFWLATY